jgi:hypothetical protein
MKPILFFSMFFASAIVVAQPQIIKQATISTTTTVIAPEGEDVQNIQGAGGGNQFFRNFGDGETKSTTYIKDSLVKTVMKNDMGRSTIIRNNGAKLTTTLLEIMGNKTGFFISDDEQAVMKVKMDSMMQARRNNDSTKPRPAASTTPNPVEISYVDETKKVAGYTCKKAYVITTRLLGIKDTVAVWYNPELKFEQIASTGGTSSFGGFGNVGNFTSLNGLDKIDGFVMYYEMNMRRGRRMIVEVTKIDIKKEVTDKEFEIPKDFDVKPMKEFQGMMQGMGNQFRMGGQQ